MRYKPKSIAALHIALGGLPDKMRVEVDRSVGVSAKTVGELRNVTTWPENLVVTTPQESHPESSVKVSKAQRGDPCLAEAMTFVRAVAAQPLAIKTTTNTNPLSR
jgi:hypothetical protein